MEVNELYTRFNEELRLSKNRASRVELFKVKDGPFCFMTVGQMRQLMKKNGIEKVVHFAADGLSELLGDKINAMSEDQFREWLNFHFHTCEKSECLGYSNHIVFVAKNV